MHSLQAQTGYNCTRKFGFKIGRASKRSKVLDIYIAELQSIDHWISYLVRNPCRFFTVLYKRLRLECFHFAVNEKGNLTPFWKTLFAYLALGSRIQNKAKQKTSSFFSARWETVHSHVFTKPLGMSLTKPTQKGVSEVSWAPLTKTTSRAIFWETRESQDPRQKIEFCITLPKHPF